MILSSKFWQKKTVFFIIILLLLSNLLFLNKEVDAELFADEGLNEEDSVYFTSTFDDIDELFGGCVLSDAGNKITLDPLGSQFANYNFSDWNEDSSNEARRGEIFWFSPLFPKSFLNSFESKVESGNYYWAMSEDDAFEYPRDGRVNPSARQQFHHFRFKITQDIDTISSFEVLWKGTAENHKNVKLYVWSPVYSIFGIWQEIDRVVSNSSVVELTYQNESLPLDEEGFLDLCVVVVPELAEECYIQTNYINVKVQGIGYATNGAARFLAVSPKNITRWERFSWSGYEKSGTTISFQFFDEDDGDLKLIDDDIINGNSEGISENLIDLSNLPTSTNLTVNVTLQTTDLSYTPELYEWGVSWQKSDEYWMDRFSSKLRIDETQLRNIHIADGKANLVTTVYDWPMFGHNAQNSRASPGLGPGTHASLCWESQEQVGGNQKNPIVNDGIIYIANDKSSRIYAYDAQYDNGFIPNERIDASESLGYDIKNSAVAATQNTIVVATGSSMDGGGISNKVYGLNANELQTQEWMFSYEFINPDDSDICFESSPVIKDNKIYVTSWNGDSSLLTDVFDFLNLSTGNNVLLCLTDTGSYEWSVDLPAGSFSSPTVGENIVIAGCEKINGESLQAFTLDGTKLWGVDVGPIGYASPVILDDMVYVVSKKVTQTLVTAYTQVTAVNLSSGTIQWNMTIGDMVPELYPNAAFSSPSVANGFVYVVSPDGTLYKIDGDDGSIVHSIKFYNKGISSKIVRSSPAYADEIIYIGTPEGYLKAFSAVTLEQIWQRGTDVSSAIYGSPIIVDGFIYYTDESGFLYCRGKQQISEDQQITGTLISMPITLPVEDIYWGLFDVQDNTNTGSITYSILNENYNVLINDIEDNEQLSNDVLENIDTIRFKAEFQANAKETVTLDSWKVSFTNISGDGETVFRNFEKNLTFPPRFSVQVRNEEIGLINTSSRFKLEYSNVTNGTFETDWLKANFTGLNQTTELETISVNMSYFDFIGEIDLYHQIRFSINDTEYETTYSDWYTIEGKPDEEPPLFYLDSFTPDPPYITSLTPTCTIKAQDVGSNGNITGINVQSAEFTIRYNNEDTFSMQAQCSGSNGTQQNVTITANISQTSIADDITSLDSIRFYIEDMEGNDNQTDWIELLFDDTPPSSFITNDDDIPQFNNASFIRINATGSDPDETGEFTSGIKDIRLYYRKTGSAQWTQFGSPCTESPCSWQFEIGSNAGGEYELCTIATDNASNKEAFPSEGDVFFVYDPNPPTVSFPNTVIEITENDIPPSFGQVTFKDDYQLDRIYYRLNSDGIENWTLITTTSQEQLTPEWSITESQWNDMIEDEITYIFFKVIDALGNTFVTQSTGNAMRVRKNIEEIGEFVLDIQDFDTWQLDNTYTIRVNTQNTTVSSMILWYRFAGEDENASSNWTAYKESLNSTPYEWDFYPEEGKGYYQFYAEIITTEGTKTTSVETVYVTLFPLIELVIALALTMILFVASGLVIKKYRGRKKKQSI